MISGRAILAGVAGWPVAHSRSPLLHNHWLARYRIDGAYVPLAIRPEDFTAAIDGLRKANFVGLNVTIPHKERAASLCDVLDESARRAGAVNTLIFDQRGIVGSNTDGYGFIANLAAHDLTPQGPALLLGAGGAARAIAAALLDAGASVTITNRTHDRAEQLAAMLPGLRVIPWDHRADALAEQHLLVNTTSLGMSGHPPLDMDLSRATHDLAVADIVYVPLETPLLTQARERNLRIVPGLGMLLHQAVPGFTAWFGKTPIVDQECYELLASHIQAA